MLPKGTMTKRMTRRQKDKSGHMKLAGRRLGIALDVKNYRRIDLAEKFNDNVQEETITTWIKKRGLPKKRWPAVAYFFGVEEWVFLDENITDPVFKKIISNPQLMKKYRPVYLESDTTPFLLITFNINKPKDRIHKSKPFLITGNRVLVNVSFWASERLSYVKLYLEKKRDKNEPYIQAGFRLPTPEFSLCLEEDKQSAEKITGEHFFNVEPGHYYISIYSRYKARVLVYEMRRYPKP